MKNPVSTYRVQLSPEYTFDDLEQIVDYLDRFGISTIYSAPFFQARKGSSHGYDITDPFRLNREIGRLESFKKISQRLKQKQMTWLQDIVPNHMAFDGNNVWMQDIFELGPQSKYFNFFDIDWKKEEKLMAPFLGNPLAEVLDKKELQLKLLKKGFSLNYFDHSYAASARSYAVILDSEKIDASWREKFGNFSGEKEDWEELKEFFLRELDKDQQFRSSVEDLVEKVNASEDELKEILELQYYLPTHWKQTEEEINYRRFFTINDLICLRMEDKEVFDAYHSFIFQLVEEGFINGLRIDHIDGLFDPLGYLNNLREVLGPDFYIVIEKILEWDEKLPAHWPVQGTSGYGFLAAVNQLLTDETNEDKFLDVYQDINPKNSEYAELVYKQKLFILNERMGGEYNNLWELALKANLLQKENRTEKGKEALGVFLAGFPVYRIYPEDFPLKKRQKKIIEEAYSKALDHSAELEKELKDLKEVFLGEADKDRDDLLYFLQRCQQFTGPLAAKGVEDTSFYIYNELISHNEVGDSPENFGITVSDFHKKMQKRNEDFPQSINATATHDTKRGEDSRMRINVLSEIAEEWFQKVEEWRAIGKELRKNRKAPNKNEEYFIFQMLIGAWPFEGEPGEEFYERSTAYLQKVLREAKENSSWAAPNEEYEHAVFEYLKLLINNKEFLSSFTEFHKKTRALGAVKSLAQSLLKITAPGIPDIYQGTELWDLSYVDPDNRRPVDYELRKKYLSEIENIKEEERVSELNDLKENFVDARLKMYTLHKALRTRKELSEVFEQGEYIPLPLQDEFSEQVVAFARKDGNNFVVVIAPILISQLFEKDLNLKSHLSEKNILKLSQDFPSEWQNAFTGKKLDTKKGISVGDIFSDFPVALLKNQK